MLGNAIVPGMGLAIIVSTFGVGILGSLAIGVFGGAFTSLLITKPESYKKAIAPVEAPKALKPSPWIAQSEGANWQTKPYSKKEQEAAYKQLEREGL